MSETLKQLFPNIRTEEAIIGELDRTTAERFSEVLFRDAGSQGVV